ncbi:dienelactone hydrolase [Phyllobacterium endophyticum]|nr:dienelactone hydrolase [Phyllobacterium endophyticum]
MRVLGAALRMALSQENMMPEFFDSSTASAKARPARSPEIEIMSEYVRATIQTGLIMKILKLATILAIAAFSTFQSAQAAGLRFIEVPSSGGGPVLTATLWYPCVGKPARVAIGFDYSTAVQDCPLTGEKLPLIVISHGVGGWSGNYHSLAEALADAGFVVAAVNHPRDSGQSKTRDPNDIASMTQRPVDMTRLVDFMLDLWSNASQLDPARIGVFGFSRGGFTGLAMIGGNPNWKLLLDNCPTYPGNRFCEQIRSSVVAPLVGDQRIKAAVLIDPAGGSLFTAEGLRNVTVPVQLWASEYGGDGLSQKDAATIAYNLPARPDYRIVPNSGHFSFLPPCSQEFAKLVVNSGEPELCTDKAGFDRLAFHKQLNADILTFFGKYLVEAEQ